MIEPDNDPKQFIIKNPVAAFKRWLISILKAPKLKKNEEVEHVVCSSKDNTGRKRQGDALRESEERFRKIYQNVAVGIACVSMDFRIEHANTAYCQMLGYKEDELIGKHLSDITGKETLDDNLRKQEALARGEIEHYRMEKRFIHKSGTSVYGILDANLIRDADAKPSYFLGSVVEITELKRIERLQEKRIDALTSPLDGSGGVSFEELFHLDDIQRLQDDFANATGVASIITRTDGTPITRSSNFCRLCNDIIRKTEKGLANCYKSDARLGSYNTEGPIIQPCMSGGLWDAGAGISVGGRHIANWLIGQVRSDTQTEDKMREYAREIQTDEEAFIKAFREVPAMSREQFGQVSQALFTLANQLSNTAYQNVQQARFITERKRAEELLRESEERYKNFFDNALIGLFRIRISDGTFIEINSKAAEQQGLPIEEIVGKVRAIDLYRTPRQWRELASKLRKDGEAHGFEADLTLHDGRDVTFSISVKAYPDKDYLEGAVIDITERKRMEKEKARIEDQYRQAQKVEAIGRLAGGVAHDLNNLLVPILGYGEMLMEDFSPKDARRESVSQIVSAGFKARDLVRQLLAFGRKQSLEYKTLDLNKIIRGFKKLVRRTIREDILIEIILSPGIRTVQADIGNIEQVIMNLAVNAQDAMPEGGRLTLETAMAELDEEYAASRPGVKPGLYVMLAVSDTGCGMNAETRSLIFEPFFSTKGEQGTGMGLATIYGIVKQHGGNIWVYSEPGKGTTFKIYLPVSEDAHIEVKTSKKEDGDLRGSETVLLVEDNKQVRKLANAILKRRGYTVLMAESGTEALAVLASHHGPVHLLLTDVVMPEMNGTELFIQAAVKRPHLKALYMSGYTGKVIAHHGVIEEGLNFIQKPFSAKILAAKLREVLDND